MFRNPFRKRRTNGPTPLQRRGQLYVDRLRGQAPPPRRDPGAMPRIGVALGGGSARGLSHIPYIEAMDEMGLPPSIIAGTSIGALIGAGWASGMSGQALREHSCTVLSTLQVIGGRLWSAQIGDLAGLWRNGLSVQLDGLAVVNAFTPESLPQTFEALKVPLYVVATDYQSWHQVVFNAGPLRPAIAGSISIPSFFRPVSFANHLLVDGGVVNPLPVDQAAECDVLVAIDVNGDPAANLTIAAPNAVDTWFGSAQIMMHSLMAQMLAAYPPDVFVRPKVAEFGFLEFWRVKEILAAVEADKDNFKRQLSRAIDDFIADPERTAATEPLRGVRQDRK
ncbi:MAG: patatin-like phospholipase family protein [Devosia sp.]